MRRTLTLTPWRGQAPRRRLLAAATLLVTLAGCGGGGTELPTPVSTTDPDAVEQPTRMVIERDDELELPGRLLFTQGGQVWMRHDSQDTLLIPSGKAVQPALDPTSGERLAYVQREESYSDIYIRGLGEDGRGLQITQNEEPGVDARSDVHVRATRWAFHPDWSPDGERLAFVSQKYPPSCGGTGQQGDCEYTTEWPLSLYIYDVERAELEDIAGPADMQVVKADTDLTHPDWSPDGRYIAYAEAYRYADAMTIGLYDTELGESVELAGIPQGAYDPAWSPDGRWLVFALREGGKTDLWAITTPLAEVNEPVLVRLTELGNVRAPAWSPDPDSPYLAFLVTSGSSIDLKVAAVELDGGRPSLGKLHTLLAKSSIDVDSGISWEP